MKNIRLLAIYICLFLLVSCNASILMSNGEITKPEDKDVDGGSDSSENITKELFASAQATGVNATKSYYTDKIVIKWNSVENADYYTLERVEHQNSEIAAKDEWSKLQEAILDTSYTDDGITFSPLTYYSYRVTPHTFLGLEGSVSEVATGTVLAEPQTITASKGTSSDRITITWDSMPYVEGYKIYKSYSSVTQGSDSDLIATVSASTNTSGTFSYDYVADLTKDSGKDIYFFIKSVGPYKGNSSSLSYPRIGYILTPGAPLEPEVMVTKATDLKNVTIYIEPTSSDDDEEDEITYTIRRSYSGGSEELIFSGTKEDLASSDIDSYSYMYVDSSCMENVIYTYYVTASNNEGTSSASEDKGYRLSPASELTLYAVNDGVRFGYEYSFTAPVGGDENDFSYVVRRTYKDGRVELDQPVSSIDELDTYFPVLKAPSKEEELLEIRMVEIKVVNSAGLETRYVKSAALSMIPDEITSISATANSAPRLDEVANANGVYPVHISWVTDFSGPYTLIRTSSTGEEVELTIKKGSSYSDSSTLPLIKYSYSIYASDELGRIHGSVQSVNNVYGAITFETYKNIFESVALKPWEKQAYVPDEYKEWWKNTTLATMIGYGNASDLSTQTKALGSATANDHFGNGSISYNASMEGVGGQIYFTYVDFGESYEFKNNGSYEMHVNASGTGTAASSTDGFTITGMYPGHIGLDNISVSKKAFTGKYTIRQDFSDESQEREVDV